MPGTTTAPVAEPEELTNRGVDRGVVLGDGVRALATWSLRVLIIGVAVAALLWLLGKLWVGVFPVLLALILSTVLWPLTARLRRAGAPSALAAIGVIVAALAIGAGILGAIVPSVVDQAQELASISPAIADGMMTHRHRFVALASGVAALTPSDPNAT